MSTTYSVGKRAAAMVSKDGTIYYALFEETYESNVYPRNPHWSAIYFGTAEACMDRIIRRASSCEGGCLKEQGGWTSPSAYIKHWRGALANPTELLGAWAVATFGTGIYEIAPEKRGTIEAILKPNGYETISDNKLRFEFREMPEALQAILDAGNPAWRVINLSQCSSTPASWAAYRPAKSKGLEPDISVWFIRSRGDWEADYWIQDGTSVASSGWAYSTIGGLINTYATKSERERPDSAEATIRYIRALVKDARAFPSSQAVLVERAKSQERYHAEYFDILAKKLGMEGQTTISTTIGQIQNANAQSALRSLADAMVSWPGLPEIGRTADQLRI